MNSRNLPLSAPTALWLQTLTHGFSVGASEPNSGPHACVVNTLLDEPSLQPLTHLSHMKDGTVEGKEQKVVSI